MAEAKTTPTEDVAATYISNAEHPIRDLLINLIPMLYGGAGRTIGATEENNEELLVSIIAQCDNALTAVTELIEGLGVAQAIAMESENMPKEALVQIGWGNKFLASAAEAIDQVRSDTDHMRRNGLFDFQRRGEPS
jgi:hypothetical protein